MAKPWKKKFITKKICKIVFQASNIFSITNDFSFPILLSKQLSRFLS